MTDHPTQCDIPNCRTLYLGTNSSGDQVFKRGKADVFVTDRHGIVRGCCCAHYTQLTDRAGTSRMADLVDEKGGLDPVKVKSHWDSGAQVELPTVEKRHLPPSAPKGLASVLEDLELPPPPLIDGDVPPDWFGDRP